MRCVSKLLLQASDFEPTFRDLKITGVFNPAVAKHKGKVFLVVRVAEAFANNGGTSCPIIVSTKSYKVKKHIVPEKEVVKTINGLIYLKEGVCRLRDISHFRLVELSSDGMKVLKVWQKPFFVGSADEEEYGVEDPRITKIDGRFYMTYVGVSERKGISTYLASSSDLKIWKRHGLIFQEQNKDVVLFPRKVKGEFVALNRPESSIAFRRPSIWISFSRDLVYWGKETPVLLPRKGKWDSERIGAGTPPIQTPKGWLVFYHGVRANAKGKVYSAGAFVLDLRNPRKVLARTPANKPLLEPTAPYEKKGTVNNVVFPTGALVGADKESVLLYCGASDSAIAVKKLSIKKVLSSLEWF
ncbi:glycosidase [Candidatus Pacearchaeota archaeon]|nr:MAG: glycosidase [Candidatus Pacearchaeota archaeon]